MELDPVAEAALAWLMTPNAPGPQSKSTQGCLNAGSVQHISE
jgi:hypothetical protein